MPSSSGRIKQKIAATDTVSINRSNWHKSFSLLPRLRSNRAIDWNLLGPVIDRFLNDSVKAVGGDGVDGTLIFQGGGNESGFVDQFLKNPTIYKLFQDFVGQGKDLLHGLVR